MKEINFPTQSSYSKELSEKGRNLIEILEESSNFKELIQRKKGFKMMFDYFLNFPASSLKDFNDYRKTRLREEYSEFKDFGTKEFIKEIYNLREKNLFFRTKKI